MRLTFLSLLFFVNCSFSQIESFEGLKSINGTKLFVKIVAHPAKAKKGKGEPLLIVHGGPGFNHTYFLPHLKNLEKQYTLIYYDQRASGKSSIPAADSTTLKFFADDIEGIRKSLSIDKLLILCHSWGAIPVVQYALDYPNHVKGLIFCNPVALSHEYDEQAREAQMKLVTSRDSTNRSIIIGSPDFRAGKADAYRRLMMLSFQHSFFNEQNFSKLKLELQDKYKLASSTLYQGLGKDLASFNFYNSLQRFKFPVLILHGKADALPLSASQRMLEQIPNSRLAIFRSSGHFIFIEEPKRFYSEITSFTKMMNEPK